MAAIATGLCKCFVFGRFERSAPFFARQSFLVNSVRNNHFFKYLANKKEHNEVDYEYEVSKDPKEWEYVERLLPYETVPPVTPKPKYSSGWRPQTDEAGSHPYYIERSKNHMLSVYLNIDQRKKIMYTRIKRINGDIWKLHDELKAHIEEMKGKKIPSFVHEGNQTIDFKGDSVYFVEQWMLSRGF